MEVDRSMNIGVDIGSHGDGGWQGGGGIYAQDGMEFDQWLSGDNGSNGRFESGATGTDVHWNNGGWDGNGYGNCRYGDDSGGGGQGGGKGEEGNSGDSVIVVQDKLRRDVDHCFERILALER
ncbi:hypothetical protein HDU76_000615, partial [Blyttiomyces sp. JEL0837]